LIYTLGLRERDLWGELGMLAPSSRIPPSFYIFSFPCSRLLVIATCGIDLYPGSVDCVRDSYGRANRCGHPLG
jgi:hypothetical protein